LDTGYREIPTLGSVDQGLRVIARLKVVSPRTLGATERETSWPQCTFFDPGGARDAKDQALRNKLKYMGSQGGIIVKRRFVDVEHNIIDDSSRTPTNA